MDQDKEPAAHREDDEVVMSEGEIDLNLIQTFPASDPPSWTLGTDHQDKNPGKESGDEMKQMISPQRGIMNLVVGATGMLGSEICRLLAAEGSPTRALVRSTSEPGKVAQLENLQLEIVRGDLKDRSSLDAACRGVTAIISTASSTLSRSDGDSIQTVDLEGQLNLIDGAKAAGVSRFLLISFPPVGSEFPLQTAKRAVEEHLKNSGLTYTILQPTSFMEVWLGPALGFDAANARVRIYGSGQNKVSWISFKDVAKFAIATLHHPAASNQVIELGGPEALSPLEVVRIFEKSQGRSFEVEHVPQQVLREQKESAADPLQQSFAALMLSYAQDSVIDMTETLRKFPVQLTSVDEYAQSSRVSRPEKRSTRAS